MLDRRYGESRCSKGNYLHKFRELDRNEYGILEKCERCGKRIHFPYDISNTKYLQWHIRDILQASDMAYEHEYNNN